VLERMIMIYLALATVATAAVFPLPVRTGTSVPRGEVPPSEPPPPARPEGILVAALAEPVPDECTGCAPAADDLVVEVAGVVESSFDRAGAAPMAEEDDDEYSVGDFVERDTLLAGPAPAPIARGQQLADLAAGLAGLPYAWGGISPATGFDCSGLVYYVHRQFGVTLGRDTTAQFRHGQPVQRGDLEPGDIVFFTDTYTSGISHDGIYLGDGRFVHAVRPGSGVRITSMSDGYWSPRYVGARRIFP
jgi:cell wall-associated NlpC family hydrolase